MRNLQNCGQVNFRRLTSNRDEASQ